MGALGLCRRLTVLRLKSGGVSIIIACAESSGKAERGVSILIFCCQEVAGVVGSFLGVVPVNLTSDPTVGLFDLLR